MLDNEVLALAKKVNDRLLVCNKTIATAESCTGGLLAGALTSVPGSSGILYGGFVTYANAAKTEMIGVPDAVITRHGAVSPVVARMMAEGALRRAGTDLAISTTGIAGPGGATDEKPIGLVHFGLAMDGRTIHREMRYGDLGRAKIREESVRTALEMILEVL